MRWTPAEMGCSRAMNPYEGNLAEMDCSHAMNPYERNLAEINLAEMSTDVHVPHMGCWVG